MGLQSYRFSVAWPRILPEGRGPVNERAVDHYNRLIDRLLKMGVQPLLTAYHWDLPQTLEDAGGWPNRDTAERFADYVQVLARRFGDRVTQWCLMNEMQAFAVAGYGWGVHAPGLKDRGLTLRAAHTSNLAQGAGCRALKAEQSAAKAGVAHDMVLFDPATGSGADREACQRFHAFRNLWYLDPPLTGKYPEAFVDGVPYEAMGWKAGDEERMRAPLDFSGMNFYGGRLLVAAGDKPPLLKGLNAHQSGEERKYPGAMERACLWMWSRYKRPVVITETGFDEPDVLTADGKVHDSARIEYLRDALANIRRAIIRGADVRGVHVWSLIDDWEWQGGFKYRIGLAYVDFKNPTARIAKDSAEWYGKVARSHRLDV
jgi:beta-glucosidase